MGEKKNHSIKHHLVFAEVRLNKSVKKNVMYRSTIKYEKILSWNKKKGWLTLIDVGLTCER